MTATVRWWRAQRCLICQRPRRVHVGMFHGPCLATYDDFVGAVEPDSGRSDDR